MAGEKRTVAPLHDGHAPLPLQEAFLSAVEAYETWTLDAPEPTVDLDGEAIPISSIFGRLRLSTDVVPQKSRLALNDALPGWEPSGDEMLTFATAASALRELCLERLKADSGKP